jgi:DNA-binding NarL/FixJ family response regulator
MATYSSKSVKKGIPPDIINVLLVGNNPIEMSALYEGLNNLKGKIAKVNTAFSDDDTLKKIASESPNCIIIDDNLGLKSLKILIDKINHLGKEAISITLLKTKNTQEAIVGVQEYLLKESITPERIYSSLKNAIKFRKTQKYLRVTYYTGKKRLKRMFI